MTEKERFQANYQGDCLVSITDKQNHEPINTVQMVDLLNEFNDENAKLNVKNDNLIFLSAHIQAKNDKLTEENKRLIKMLDNVSDYLQKYVYKDISIPDFVEWWNNMVIEGIDE